jgi:hypothetical protein
MNITYAWTITALKKAPSLDGLSNVITHIRFDYTGTDSESGESYTFHGACPISAPDSENFSDISTLTEAQVIEWAQAHHPTEHMDYVIEKAISDKLVPKNEEVTELDWLQTEEAAPAADETTEPEE